MAALSPTVTLCSTDLRAAIDQLFAKYGLHTRSVDDGKEIPGSFWGDCEAGLVGDTLYLRADTPLHSALHEGCHYICMDDDRRAALHTDAGGSVLEENAVCYLQALLAANLPGYSCTRLFADMDDWGYSFRLGSARAWFENDADDARQWLQTNRLIDSAGRPTWRLRK